MKIIGLDIGTTNIKGLVINEQGQILDTYSQEITTIKKQGGFREQDINQMVKIVLKIIKHLKNNNADVTAFSVSATMHTLILLDANNVPLTNSIIYSDTRSAKILSSNNLMFDFHQIHKISGVPVHPMSWIGKILWFQKHKKKIWTKTTKIVSFKEYLILKLFGVFAVDYSIAASSGLMQLTNFQWNNDLLNIINIPQSMLSKIVSPITRFENLLVNINKTLGFNIPMVIGSSDGCLANLGSGVIDNSKIAISVGTSSAVRTTMNQPWIDDKHRIFCYPIFKDFYVIGGPSNNAGNVLNWYQNQIRESLSFKELWVEFSQSPVGANNIIFLPYINGERAPYWDATATGAFININATHNKNDFTKALVEGVSMAIASIILILQEKGSSYNQVIISGGILASPPWIQLIADITRLAITIINTSQTSAMGAAYIGFMSYGILNNVKNIQAWISNIKTFKPNQENSIKYAGILTKFIETYYRLHKKME